MKQSFINSTKIIITVFVVCGLYAFTSSKNNARKVKKINVSIVKAKTLLITPHKVRKMLIEKSNDLSVGTKNNVILRDLESLLEKNSLIERAEVFMSINGELNALVIQRNPVVRVQTKNPFYLDSLGHKISLSKVSSPRVPIVTGWEDDMDTVHLALLASVINHDKFLKEHIVSLWKNKKDYMMGVRRYHFNIRFGKVKHIESKFLNFKAFYQRAFQEKKLDKYREVNLKYKRQVVCKLKKSKSYGKF